MERTVAELSSKRIFWIELARMRQLGDGRCLERTDPSPSPSLRQRKPDDLPQLRQRLQGICDLDRLHAERFGCFQVAPDVVQEHGAARRDLEAFAGERVD